MAGPREFKARPNQLLAEHLGSVAELAAGFARRIGLGEAMARKAGLLHDLGKYGDEFQQLVRADPGERRERVEHAGHGAALAAEGGAVEVAFAVGGHHAGLHDKAAVKDLAKRDQHAASGGRLIEAARRFLDRARCEAPEFQSPDMGAVRTQDDDRLRIELRTRMLFSCLVDADRLDAERCAEEPDRLQRGPSVPLDPAGRLGRLKEHVAGLVRSDAQGASPEVREARREVFEACLAHARRPPGLFSLTVPTGGGKTLASLAFALSYALEHGLDRVIVVMPYLAIIEQNAQCIRDAVGAEVVLEHHSAAEDEAEDDGSPSGPCAARRLAAENWDAPLVITTAVQFFESIFSNRPSKCRKLHRIARSVVILDEVQVLPPKLLSGTLGMVQALCRDYGTSFVFCTATQPAFEKASIPGFAPDPRDARFEPGSVSEIMPEPAKQFARLKRIRPEWPAEGVALGWDDIAQRMNRKPQCLCVVNTKAHALELYRTLRQAAPEGVFHLSTRMCPLHRLKVMKEARRRLESGEPCRLVSTQMVEAGVDLDFPLVLRAFGPLDSLAQAAGRCNRHGRLGFGEFVVFRPRDEKFPDGLYKTASAITAGLLPREGAGFDLDRPEIYRRYFNELYAAVDCDARNIVALREALDFPGVSAAYRIIEEATHPVAVPFDEEAAGLIDKLRQIGIMTREHGRRLQRYIVNLNNSEFRQAIMGSLEPLAETGLFVCMDGRYNAETGIELGGTDPRRMVV